MSHTATRPSLALDRATVLDDGLLLVTGAAALSGLASSFVGWQFLLVGCLGLALGISAVRLATTLRWPFVAPVLIGLAVFYLLGPVLCLRSVGAALPGPTAARLLTDQVLYGWKDFLTTLPPVDGGGPLLTLPWLLGLVTGILGAALARLDRGPRVLRVAAPVLVPLVLLAVVILLGLAAPPSLWVQGAVLAALSLAWTVIRASRDVTTTTVSHGRWVRWGLGAAILGVAGALAVPLSPLAAGSADARFTLRPRVAPPFDVGQYGSPLASFRRYVKNPASPVNLNDKPLVQVTGVDPGTRVRFATLDHYDGKVWGASNNAFGNGFDDGYQRVSSTIDNPGPGRTESGRVTLEQGWSGVWLPTVGRLQHVHFDGPRMADLAESFRYDLVAQAGVVPMGLAPGDGYDFTSIVDDRPVRAQDQPGVAVNADSDLGGFVDTQAQAWSKGASTAMQAVLMIADHLKSVGKYSDGVLPAEQRYHAGHNIDRLGVNFVNQPAPVGDDEQYAATMALMADRVGVPARVVLGAVVPPGGVVKGSDVHAWVELLLSDGTWRTLATDQFMSDNRPAKQPPQQQPQMTGTVIPPPAPQPPPSTVGDQSGADFQSHKTKATPKPIVKKGPSAPGWIRPVLVYGGVPLLAVLIVVGAILGAKAWRRHRRRSASSMSARVVGAWHELLDHARDLGQPVALGPELTRREQVSALGSTAAAGLARRADSAVFGPQPPGESGVAAYWGEVDAERRAMSSSVGRRRRALAALNLTTFLRGSGRGGRPRLD